MGWVLDLDGVIWLGDAPIAGSADAVSRLQSAGETVVFVTNMSRLRVGDQEAKLASHGIDAVGRVVTSAMAAARLVEAGESVVVVGGPGIVEAVEARGARVVDAERADAVIVGFDPEFTFDDLTRGMRPVRNGARLIGTNHDPTYPTAAGLQAGGGSIVAAVAYAAEVEATMGGKPNPAAADCVKDLIGPSGIVVGDRPDSDGLFAVQLGYEFGLVLSGVTTESDLPVTPTPSVVAADLAALVTERLG